jgi:hypothetical protein
VDLRTYIRVIWRFRLIVGVGFALAVLLALLSFAKVSFAGGKPSIAYRQAQTWTATTTLAVTLKDAPVGSPTNANGLATQAFYYAGLATSDPVLRLVAPDGKLPGAIVARPVIDPQIRAVLPFVNISAFATHAGTAVALANSEASALRTFVQRQQTTTASTQKVDLVPVDKATGATISTGRKKTTPIVIFLTVMIAAIGLAFILENLRPRVHVVGRDVDEQGSESSARRSA